MNLAACIARHLQTIVYAVNDLSYKLKTVHKK